MSAVLIDHGTPPSITTALLPYESYTEDPIWQIRVIRFTAMWGAYEGVPGDEDADVDDEKIEGTDGKDGKIPESARSKVLPMARVVDSVRLWSLPGITLSLGQMSVVAGYAVFALVYIVLKVPLVETPNTSRAGFLALALLPPVFLFASKNSPLPALLLGPGVDYTKLSYYVHRQVACDVFVLEGAKEEARAGQSAWTCVGVRFCVGVGPFVTGRGSVGGLGAKEESCC